MTHRGRARRTRSQLATVAPRSPRRRARRGCDLAGVPRRRRSRRRRRCAPTDEPVVARACGRVRGALVRARRCPAAAPRGRRGRPDDGVGDRARARGQRARAPDPRLTGRGPRVRIGRAVATGPAPSADRALARIRELVQLSDLLPRRCRQPPLHGRDARHAGRRRLAARRRAGRAVLLAVTAVLANRPGTAEHVAVVLGALRFWKPRPSSRRTPGSRSPVPRRCHGRRRPPTPAGRAWRCCRSAR